LDEELTIEEVERKVKEEGAKMAAFPLNTREELVASTTPTLTVRDSLGGTPILTETAKGTLSLSLKRV
jgi:hypothetical protein